MPEPEDRSPFDLLCDLLVYAPVGFAFEAPKLLPELATKGRDQVAAARSVGQFVVRKAGTRLGPVVGSLLSGMVTGLTRAESTEGAAPPAAALPAGADGQADGSPAPPPEQTPPSVVAAADVPAAESLAIPHYDSLAASQVVPRLAALSEEELAALRAYESAHRGRRTILNRTEQLLGRARERA